MSEQQQLPPTTKTTPPALLGGGQDDSLGMLAGETAARVAWVHEQIAEHFYQPAEPTLPWAGRDDVVQAASRHFKIADLEAVGLVDQAVAELWVPRPADEGPVMKRLMLLRLRNLRQLVLRWMREGRRDVTYRFEYEPHPTQPNTLIEKRTKVKEKVYEGDLGAVDVLRNLEADIAALEGLAGKDQGGAFNVVTRIFAELDKLAAKRGESGGGQVASMAQRMRQLPIEQLAGGSAGGAGAAAAGKLDHATRKLLEGVSELSDAARRARRVTAKPLDDRDGGDGGETEGEAGGEATGEARGPGGGEEA